MAVLPYVTAAGNVGKALTGIKTAATPERVSQDFVKTILKISGGSGNQITAYLRKIGFANSDGTPSSLYNKFRNTTTEGAAAAEAMKIGYAPLSKRNEFWYRADEGDLRGLIIEETGVDADSAVVELVLGCIKQLKKFATWEASPSRKTDPVPAVHPDPPPERDRGGNKEHDHPRQLRMNLGYTINLNLPATSDAAVFNAIFKSLKEHLLKGKDE